MQQQCDLQPTLVEMLDALEAGIAALRLRPNLYVAPPASSEDPKRVHPFSKIEEL
jgi:hypothetical protein